MLSCVKSAGSVRRSVRRNGSRGGFFSGRRLRNSPICSVCDKECAIRELCVAFKSAGDDRRRLLSPGEFELVFLRRRLLPQLLAGPLLCREKLRIEIKISSSFNSGLVKCLLEAVYRRVIGHQGATFVKMIGCGWNIHLSC